MSDDPKQEFFADGITEEIITALSKVPNLLVIARNSTFTYKGKPMKVKQVSEELGVRYVLEGSVRREGDRVRITAQLIDALEGHHLWAERYDRELKEIFAVQDEVTLKILASVVGKTLGGKFVSEETLSFGARGTKNLEAYQKWMEGNVLIRQGGRDNIVLARKKYEEAIALDPQWAVAHASFGFCYVFDFRFTNRVESLNKAYEYAQKAISLDEKGAEGYMTLAQVRIVQRRYEDAEAAAEQAVKLAPGTANAYAHLGDALLYAGREREALGHYEKGLRIDPLLLYLIGQKGCALFILREYEEAIALGKKALSISPKFPQVRAGQVAAYVEMGRMEEARAEAEELLRIDPKWSPKAWLKAAPWKDPKVVERFAEAWRKAGLEGEGSRN